MLSLAHQHGLLSCSLPDGGESPRTAARQGWRRGAEAPLPDIATANGLGPTHAAPEVLRVLEALGLVRNRRWTAPTETLLWRCQPPEWRLDIDANPHVRAALERALTEMPEDVRAELARLATITGANVTERLDRHRAYQGKLRAEHGSDRIFDLPLTPESVRQGLLFLRRHDLDWLFFTHWRLPDGWFTPYKRNRALPILHDPLAIMMRKAVVERMFPGRTEMAE